MACFRHERERLALSQAADLCRSAATAVEFPKFQKGMPVKIPRRLAVVTLALSTFVMAPRLASPGCSTSCTSTRSQTEICSTCCRLCISDKGVVTYDNCDTRCISM